MRNSECGIIYAPFICRKKTNFRRGGFHIRPIIRTCLHKHMHTSFRQIFCRGRVARSDREAIFDARKCHKKQNVPIFNGFIQ